MCSLLQPTINRLFDLVRDCLSPRPGDRPDPDKLVVQTLQGLKRTREKIGSGSKPGGSSQYRPYYRRREIEEMLPGPYRFPANEGDLKGAKTYSDSGVPLKLQEPKWKQFNDARKPRQAPDPTRGEAAVQREYQRYQQERQKQRDQNEKLVKRQLKLDRTVEKKRPAQTTKKQSNLLPKPATMSKNQQWQAPLGTGPQPAPLLQPKAGTTGQTCTKDNESEEESFRCPNCETYRAMVPSKTLRIPRRQ